MTGKDPIKDPQLCKDLIENANDMIQCVDRNGNIVYANGSWKRIMGYTEEDLRSLNIFDIICPRDLDHCREMFKEVIDGCRKDDIEVDFVTKDGSEIPLHGSSFCYEIDDEKFTLGIFRNIGSLRDKEKELEESKNLLERAQEMGKMGNWIYDLNKENFRWSGETGKILELSEDLDRLNFDELIGLLPNEEADRLKKDVIGWLDEGKVGDFHFRIKTPSGRKKYLHSNAEIVYDESGKPYEVIGTLQDITQFRETERMLRESEAKFRKISSSAKDAIVMIDEKGRVTFWNEAAERIFGYPENEVMGKDIHKLIAPDHYHDDCRRGLKHFKITGDGPAIGKTQEMEGLRKSGEVFPVELSLSSVEIEGRHNAIGIMRDISKRKRDERSLIETEKKYRDLFENSNDAIVIHNLDGDILDVNRTSIEEFGYSRKEFRKMSIDSIHPPELKYHAEKGPKEVMRKGYARFQTECVRKDGSVFNADINARIVDEKKGIIQGEIRDITEVVKTKRELEVQKAYLENLLENAPEGIAITDNEGKVTGVNREFQQMFGYTPDEAYGEDIIDLTCNDEMKEEARRILKRVIKKEKISLDTRRIRKDGSIFDVSILGSPIVIDGEQKGIYGIYRDITEIKENLRELKLQKAYLEDLFEGSPEAIVVLGRDNVVKNINKKFTDLYGYTEEESIGRKIQDLVVPISNTEESLDITRKVYRGETIYEETKRRRKDGSLVDVSILGTPVHVDEDTVAVYGIYRDITERKGWEREIKDMNRKLIEADRMKDEFVSILAHDIGSPITSLLMSMDILLSGEIGELNGKQRHYMDVMKRSLEWLNTLRENTLDLSRMDVGTSRLDYSEVSPEEVIDTAVNTMRTSAEGKNQTISVDTEDLPAIRADESKLLQVITNYLGNAIRYSDEGTRINVKGERKGGEIRIMVEDQGRGIDPSELENVFERFYRTGKRVEGSTGLGLAIVKGIVDAHGGRAWAESEGEGTGSRFYFSIPIIDAPLGKD